ncbi:hypothetical protein D3C72_2028410 [compost metagenome]
MAVFLLKPDDVKIVLVGSPRLNLVPVDVHIELHKFIAGQKLRQNGQGKDIADLILAQREAEIRSPQKHSSAVHPGFTAQAVEQRGFACAVAPQQAVDFTLFISKVDAFQHLLITVALSDIIQYQLHLGPLQSFW